MKCHMVNIKGGMSESNNDEWAKTREVAESNNAEEAKTEEAAESNHAVEMKASVPAGVTRLTTYTCRLCLQPCGLVGSKQKGIDPKIREEDRCASICRCSAG